MARFEETYKKLRAIVIQEATTPITTAPTPNDEITSSPEDNESTPPTQTAMDTIGAPADGGTSTDGEPTNDTSAATVPTKPAPFAMTEITDDAKKNDLISGKVIGLEDNFSSFLVVGTDKNDAISKLKAAKDTIGYVNGKLQENLNIPIDDKTSVNVYRFYVLPV